MARTIITMAFLLASCTMAVAQDVPKEVLQEMAFLVGEWEATGTFNGEATSGTYSAQWAPGRHCLILTSQSKGSGSPHASGIGGWSPDQKKYVEYWYGSDGLTLTARYTLGTEKDVWLGEIALVNKEGQKGSGKSRLEKGTDEYRVSGTAELDGEKIVIKSIAKKIK